MVSELQQLHAAGEQELGLERTEMIEKLDNNYREKDPVLELDYQGVLLMKLLVTLFYNFFLWKPHMLYLFYSRLLKMCKLREQWLYRRLKNSGIC